MDLTPQTVAPHFPSACLLEIPHGQDFRSSVEIPAGMVTTERWQLYM